MPAKSAYNADVCKKTQEYNATRYDQIAIRVPKGKRDEYNALAAESGQSLAGLIVDLLEAEKERRGRDQSIYI